MCLLVCGDVTLSMVLAGWSVSDGGERGAIVLVICVADGCRISVMLVA